MYTYQNAINRNRWSTLFFVLLLPISFFLILVAISFFVDLHMSTYDLINIFPIVGGIAFIWMLISYYAGSKMMLNSAGAKPITRRENAILYRLVDNLSITAGLPKTPSVYIIKDSSMNAFATGRTPEKSSIAVTSGLLEKLTKPELEAVLAHEMAHIIHRDVRLMMLVITGIGFFTFMSGILFRSLRHIRTASSRNKKGNATAIIFLLAFSMAVFGYLIAPIIRFAISRKREFQADAGSVHLTRNPQAMINALKKISTDARVEILDKKQMMASVCIANPLSKKRSFFSRLAGLYATHPPIQKRIKELKNMDKSSL